MKMARTRVRKHRRKIGRKRVKVKSHKRRVKSHKKSKSHKRRVKPPVVRVRKRTNIFLDPNPEDRQEGTEAFTHPSFPDQIVITDAKHSTPERTADTIAHEELHNILSREIDADASAALDNISDSGGSGDSGSGMASDIQFPSDSLIAEIVDLEQLRDDAEEEINKIIRGDATNEDEESYLENADSFTDSLEKLNERIQEIDDKLDRLSDQKASQSMNLNE